MVTNEITADSLHHIRTPLSDVGEQNTESRSNQPIGSINRVTHNEQSFRSSVWKHTTKITPDTARCNQCGKTIKTIHGGTSSLRKHLLYQHNIVLTSSRKSSTRTRFTSISKEKKSRLDHLLKLATFQDGRSFGDFRKSAIMKFLAEAVPGENIVRPKTSEFMLERRRSSCSEADFFQKNQPLLYRIRLSDMGEILSFRSIGINNSYMITFNGIREGIKNSGYGLHRCKNDFKFEHFHVRDASQICSSLSVSYCVTLLSIQIIARLTETKFNANSSVFTLCTCHNSSKHYLV